MNHCLQKKVYETVISVLTLGTRELLLYCSMCLLLLKQQMKQQNCASMDKKSNVYSFNCYHCFQSSMQLNNYKQLSLAGQLVLKLFIGTIQMQWQSFCSHVFVDVALLQISFLLATQSFRPNKSSATCSFKLEPNARNMSSRTLITFQSPGFKQFAGEQVHKTHNKTH